MTSVKIVGERFEIARLAGSGAMGRVFEALDRESGKRVALKLMASDAPSDRFEREAEVLAALHHPNIVRYVAHGFSGAELYLAMEWLEGEDLATRLERGRLGADETLLVARQAADALAAAHAEGVVHRDVKPGNLFLVGGSLANLRLVDFGLAAVGSTKKRQLTQAGAILGTPAYMAPEQVRCEPLDARADVFSLGCVLFECLTRTCPFEGPTPIATFAKILLEEAPRASLLEPQVPAALDDLLVSMLQKQRDRRPASGRAVAEDVARLTERGVEGRAPREAASLTSEEQRLVCVVLMAPQQSAGGGSPELGRAATMLDIPAVLDDVSVDLPGDRSLAEELSSLDEPDPEWLAIQRAAGRYGGEIERLPDGSVLVVHGARDASTDPASRAARAALALRAAFPRAKVALAMGRSTGNESRKLGEAVLRASTLLSQPEAIRGIRIDPIASGILEARFELSSDDDGARLLGERAAARAERTLLGRKTACVGRDRELSLLLEVLGTSFTRREPRAVVLSAAAGVGKSRLRFEFLRRAGAAHPEASMWVGWADPMGAGSAFGLLGPLLRRVLGISDGDAPDERRRKVVARVASGIATDDARRVAEFVGELVGAHFPDEDRVQLRAARNDAVLMGDQMQRAFAELVAAEAARAPVILVLEDIHWGDGPSLRFVDAALARAEGLPLFVLASGRPEIHERFPDLWADRRTLRWTLAELDAEASRALVVNALGSADESMVRELVERAAGNAFYLEELVRAVADGRGISLPGTVLAVAQARLGGLSDGERRVLRAASIFGASFHKSGLVELLGQGAASSVDAELGDLTARELFVAVGGSGGPDERYAFRHALLRDAAYAMLTPEDCALGHRLAGAWLEQRGGADPMALAEHFERGGAPDRAAVWYRRAAEQALEGNDFSEVKARVAHAFRCGLTGREAGLAHLVAAEAHRWSNDNAGAADHACRAFELLEKGSAAWFVAAGEASLSLGHLGRFEELGDVARELQASSSLTASPAVLAALARASDQLLFAGEHALYGALVETIEALAATRRGDPVVETWLVYVRAGDAMMRDAGQYVHEMIALVAGFEALGDVRNACLQRVNLADAYIHVGDYREGASVARAALALGVDLGVSLTSVNAKHNLARALCELGELEEARRHAEEALAEIRLGQDHRMVAASLGHLARILMKMGDLSAAEATARASLAMEKAPAPVRSLSSARLAEILLEAGKLDEAVQRAGEAFEILATLGTIDEGEAYVRLIHARAELAAGRIETGRLRLAHARDKLLAKASSMSSAHFRTIFLSSVVENVATLSLAARVCR